MAKGCDECVVSTRAACSTCGELHAAPNAHTLSHTTANRNLRIGRDSMPAAQGEQPADLQIGVDVGGTFTDLVAFDSSTGRLRVVKIPSSAPDFHRSVIDATKRVIESFENVHVVHGSTVAT